MLLIGIESTLTTYVARLHNDTNPWKCTPPLSQWSTAHHMPRLRSGPLLETAKNQYQRENTSHENPVSLRPRPGHDWVKKPDFLGQVGGNSPTAGILQQGRNCQRLQPRCLHLPLGVCRRHPSNLLSELSWENCKKFVVWAAWIVLVARSKLHQPFVAIKHYSYWYLKTRFLPVFNLGRTPVPGIDEGQKSKFEKFEILISNFESRKRNMRFWSRISREEREMWNSDLGFRE